MKKKLENFKISNLHVINIIYMLNMIKVNDMNEKNCR
jgi:hypothetical protein